MAQGAVHEKLWTPANVVTLLRICLVPVFVVAIISPWPEYFPFWADAEASKPWIAAGIFILLAATDGLDGYLARSRGGGRTEGSSPQVGESFDFQLPMFKETGSLAVSIGTPPIGSKVASCQSRTHGLVLGKIPLPEEIEKPEGEENASPGNPGNAPEKELLWQLEPETGFTHQLRATLAHFGYPLVGDPLYPEVLPAKAPENVKPQLCLHAQELQFPDPENPANTVTVIAPIPTWAKGYESANSPKGLA